MAAREQSRLCCRPGSGGPVHPRRRRAAVGGQAAGQAAARAGDRVGRRAADRGASGGEGLAAVPAGRRAGRSRASGCGADASAIPDCTSSARTAGSPADADAPDIIARIRAARPDVLFVAYGAPKQDFWIAKHGAAAGRAGDDGRGRLARLPCGRAEARARRWVQRHQPRVAVPTDRPAVAMAAATGAAAVSCGR